MPWWHFALLGAAGGIIVEVLEISRWVLTWQAARRGKDGHLKRRPVKLGVYVDFPAHSIVLPVRAALGAVAAIVFGLTHQVTGPYGALAFGCAAPVLLSRIGLISQVNNAIDPPPGLPKPSTDRFFSATSEVTAPAEEGSGS